MTLVGCGKREGAWGQVGDGDGVVQQQNCRSEEVLLEGRPRTSGKVPLFWSF